MARERVEIVRCDICKAVDAEPLVLNYPDGASLSMDLCSEHMEPYVIIRKDYRRLVRRPGERRSRLDRYAAEATEFFS